MEIHKLKAFSGRRTLQSCQSIAVCHIENRTQGDVIIYDSSTGHWLDPVTRQQVGDLGYAYGEKILLIQAIQTNATKT